MIEYKVRAIPIKNSFNGHITKNEVFIVKIDTSNPNVWIPSKLTDFVRSQYANNSLNTQLKVARTVAEFMNYITSQVILGEDPAFTPLKEKGLYGLEHIHLARFINYISNRKDRPNSYQTVKDKENFLVMFYAFLFSRNITSKKAKIESKIVQVTNKETGTKRGKRVYISPLDDKSKFVVYYPSESHPRKVLKDLDQDVWEQLIEFAEENYPRIALGVVFQMMGGLRQGEVVNLTLKDVDLQKDNDCIILYIEDKPWLFDGRKIQIHKSQTKKKKPRAQAIYNFNNRLFEIWDKHMKLLAINANDYARSVGALFVDTKGQPMSGNSYETTFKSLKEKFIELVGEKSPSLEQKLKDSSWGSHIGRHVFSNHLIKTGGVDGNDGKPSPKMLQLARGDENIKSSKDYIDPKAIHDAVKQSINSLSVAAKENK